MRIFVLEPSAIDFDRSHNAVSLIGHTKAFRSHGFSVIWLTNEKSKLELPGTTCHRIFRYSIYDDVRRKRLGLVRYIYMPYYRWLVHSTTNLIASVFGKEKIGSQDHIFVPTLDWILFQALIRYLRSLKTENHPYLHLLIMYEKGHWMIGGYPYKKIIMSLKESGFLQDRIFLYTETIEHARLLQEALGITVEAYPFPSMPISHSAMARPSSKIRVCALGGGRRDKGYSLLPGIVKLYNSARKKSDRIEFVVQRPRKQDKLSAEESELEKFHNVIMLDNQLGQEEYEEFLLSCDLLLFPYDEVIYKTRGSGLVNEAVANSKPFLCTRGTSLEEQIIFNNGLTANGEEEFVAGILDMESNLEKYRDRADAAAKFYYDRYKNNAVVKRINSIRKKIDDSGQIK